MRMLFFALLLAGCATAQEGEPPAARYLAGEWIVKFEDSTPAAAALRRSGADPAADPELAGYVGEIGESLSLPLAIRQVTSGAEVLLAIDVRALVEDAAERTRGLDGVAGARAPLPDESTPPAAVYEVRLASGSRAAAALAAASAAGKATDERLDDLVTGFSRELGLPLRYRIAGGALEVEIDLTALTESTAERLRKISGILYVELNQLYDPTM